MAADEQCEHCGWPTARPFQTISRHPTSEGTVTYTRCACGALRVTLSPTAFGITRTIRRNPS
ncbi:hypothetical protein [Nocardia huaxiensis]|uniref:Uncharacterized protein n=1 Tax=Nocardia huaxiensis TaxID=2755382 RepID=A0A7D6ZVR2_9NOCA|nr:hypothetical protein [Nocardia huaxiensis]QLY29869.1 hypothetical protein H0264_32415 [Nocardia huaxiensis]UFS96543.1 hypothetical protein LPY97_00955 [Nocardia huaxiensis]